MTKTKVTHDDNFVMPGSRVRDTHAATVRGIVGARDIPVRSGGTRFSMRGPFGWRHVGVMIATGVRDPRVLADKANHGSAQNAAVSIDIAECPDNVSRRTYMALIGGATHESFHALYSFQGALTTTMVANAIRPMTDNAGIDWPSMAGLVLELQNVFEDIAIERIGNAEFPGVYTKLADLAEYVIRQEQDALAGQPVTLPQAVFTILRDVGLGYDTPVIRDNLARIRRACPQGAAMVAPGGILRDVLVRSIPDVSSPAAIEAAKLAVRNGSSLRLALEAVALLADAVNPPEQSDQSGEGDKPSAKPQQGQQGNPSNGQGQPQKAEPSKGQPGTGTPSKGQPSASDASDDDAGDDADDDAGDDTSDAEASDDGDAEASDAEASDDGDDASDAEASDGASDGDDTSDGDDASDGEASDVSSAASEASDNAEENLEVNNTPMDDSDGGNSHGAGGGEGQSSRTAKDFLDQFQAGGKGTMDGNSALEAGVSDESKGDAKPGERPYRPYSTSDDRVEIVKANESNAAAFRTLANKARKATSFLRTRLATMFRAMEQTGAEHGIRKGQRVSDRMLVDTYCELRGGQQPSRAYMDKAPTLDLSIAAALVIDESSSMSDKLGQTCAGAYTLMDSLDGIGAKTMAVGFRSGGYNGNYDREQATDMACHRVEGINYDVFKGWQDAWKVAAPRLKEIRASGGTPMSDGIEFALGELSKRPEGYRILFVLTDGMPNNPHDQVMKGQLRRAAEAGILVVGVGLGYGSEYVSTTFPDSVYAENLDTLPKLLVAKLETLVRTRATLAKRGRTVRAA